MSQAHQIEQKPVRVTQNKRPPLSNTGDIFHGTIIARAGSSIGLTSAPENSGVDPADLFGNWE